MGINIEKSERLKALPPYLFAEIDKMKEEAEAQGRDIIDLGVGDPDQPPPSRIIKSLYRAALRPGAHRYALNWGRADLRQAIASWYKKRFNVELDPKREILPLIGSKEGIAHIPLALLNPGDLALVPEPSYPPYRAGVIFAGGRVCPLPLLKENGFLPDLDTITGQTKQEAKLLFINYPNNPTSAIADETFFKRVAEFAKDANLVVCHDLAYSEIAFDGYTPLSFLQIEGAKERGIEFHSLSKTYNMTGGRIGWACGNSEVLKHLAQLKSNIDSGVFRAIQQAGITALSSTPSHKEKLLRLYQQRRDTLVDGLNALGWKVPRPKATFYVWAETPKEYSSLEFSKLLFERCGILTTPGIGFGESGEGFIRMTLTIDNKRIKEALKRLKGLDIWG